MTRLFTSALRLAGTALSIWIIGHSLSLAQTNHRQIPSSQLYAPEGQTKSVDLTLTPDSQMLAEETDFSVRLFPSATPLLKLLIANQTHSALHITLTNGNRERLYETVSPARQSWGWWKLDIANLPDGPYTLQIRAGRHRATRTFTLETRPPVVYATGKAVVF